MGSYTPLAARSGIGMFSSVQDNEVGKMGRVECGGDGMRRALVERQPDSADATLSIAHSDRYRSTSVECFKCIKGEVPVEVRQGGGHGVYSG